jgi:hypothetical protein
MEKDIPHWFRLFAAAIITGATATFVTAPVIATPAIAVEKAVAPEKNPPGDIPDTQVFIDYAPSFARFTLKVPEGWARTDNPDGASFVDKLDGVIIKVTSAATRPTAISVKGQYVPDLVNRVRAMKLEKVEAVKLPAGETIRISYSSNSEPNPVTSKQVRLENQIYLYYANGKLVSVEFYAPYGSDNVDQWRLMSRSFRWQ